MGVDLGDLVPTSPLSLKDLAGKVVAVDAYNTLYQFLATIRGPDGTPLHDAHGRVTSHLAGLLYRTANLVEAEVRPVFVWDGAPPALKRATLAERRERKEKARKEMEAALAAGDLAKARVKAQQTSVLTKEMVGQARALLDALGIPSVQAPSEGEAQAAHMARKGTVWCVASQDYDALLFRAPRIARNLNASGRRKLPGKDVWIDVVPELVELERTLAEVGLSEEALIDVGILMGTDYHPGVRGVGPKKALKLVREHGTAEAALATLGEAEGARDLAAVLDDVRGVFRKPEVTDDVTLAWGNPDEGAVVALMVDGFGFSRDRVEATFPKYRALSDAGRQRRLDEWSG